MKKKSKGKGFSVLSGRALFDYDATLFAVSMCLVPYCVRLLLCSHTDCAVCAVLQYACCAVLQYACCAVCAVLHYACCAVPCYAVLCAFLARAVGICSAIHFCHWRIDVSQYGAGAAPSTLFCRDGDQWRTGFY